ncbi:Uncharacterised protein [Mycobacteroides abscessus subsp. abscessus]|uniref:hypothetical protein n=1 Tax=Mycobacteroides abscessus TaxID=36809 RepID=UPI00092651F8|nr:hypothetical protein [Mycobacteroides abscessus]SIC56426.1 Uncharacterised protein [Mycobacteroides abscessus subsp. abscessus]SKU57698.1 Uncharacterised protein [Mycobacteroides abscessus subsp. abscessus]
MTELPGGDTLQVISYGPALDGHGNPVMDEQNQPIKARTVVATIYGCVFEAEHISEHQTDAITSTERAWAFLPVTPDSRAIRNEHYLCPMRPAGDQSGRDYKVHGLPALQYDIEGQPDHVWIFCEWQPGKP